MADLPPRVTMPLLTRITQQSLDEDYELAAARRAVGSEGSSATGSRRSRRSAAVVIAVFGVLVSTAFVQNSLSEDVDSAGRLALVERIETQRDRVDGLQSELAGLREENAVLAERITSLGEQAQTVETRLQRIRIRTGLIAVRGPGVRITLDNAPDADDAQLLRDSDLALLANALWTAGAEAIAINNQRLTALSAIRNSGVPIEVNSVGIAPPYTVLAIGDTGSLQSNLVESSSGLAFLGLERELGFSIQMDNDDELSLPAAPQRFLNLRAATATAAELSPEGEEIGP